MLVRFERAHRAVFLNMSLLEAVQQFFGTKDLYGVLNVERNASKSELKKAYYKVSLKVHPDRAGPSEKDDATAKFQTLARVYKILSDHDQRAVYDEQGIVDEEHMEFEDAYEHWRSLFPRVTLEDIESFSSSYRHSDEELRDLKEAYVHSKGSMKKILTEVPCCSFEDEERFREVIDSWISKGEVENYSKYSRETKAAKQKRKRKAEKEAAEAEELLAAMKRGKEESLETAIQKRAADRAESLFASLEAKYCQPKPKRKKTKGSSEEPGAKRLKV